MLKGVQNRLRDERAARLSHAWHVAHLTSYAYHQPGKMPDHDRIVGVRKAMAPQSLSQIAANLRAWGAVFGGDKT